MPLFKSSLDFPSEIIAPYHDVSIKNYSKHLNYLVFRAAAISLCISSNSDYHWMFPDPVKVFCSLMRCWNQFSDERRFTKEEYVAYKDWLTKNVCVSRYELQTRLAVMRNKKATGFTGWVTYELQDKENTWSKTTCMVARYAEYANVDGNKTAAYGQTKLR